VKFRFFFGGDLSACFVPRSAGETRDRPPAIHGKGFTAEDEGVAGTGPGWRVVWRAGAIAWFAFGALFAAAPWRGVWSNALTGSGAASGGGLTPVIPGAGVPRRGLGRRGDRPRLARGGWLAVLPGSRMARFLPPRRGAEF
jgi:hypothetical protein